MSVDRRDYLVYGWKMPIRLKKDGIDIDIWEDRFLPYIEGWKGETYVLVIDGMCGNYSVFGYRILSSSDYSGNGFNFETLDLSHNNPHDVSKKFEEVFGQSYRDFDLPEPSLFIFSHFS